MLSAVITVINWMEGNILLSCCSGISSEHCLIIREVWDWAVKAVYGSVNIL